MKKKQLTLVILALLVSLAMAKAQVFEHPENIKKRKKTMLTASRITHYADSAVKQEKYAYWEFDSEGREILEIDYDREGNTVTHITNTYANHLLTQTRIDRKKLQEIEITNYQYDSLGHLLKRSEQRDGKLIMYYAYFYSKEGQLDSVVWYNAKNEPQLYEYYTYKDGRLAETWEKTSYGRKDGRMEISYHADGTLKEERLYDSFGELFELLIYNEKGWLVTRKIYDDQERVLTYNYNYPANGLMKSSTKYDSASETWEEFIYKWGKKK